MCVCGAFTVEALLVDNGTAGQGFIVLLVAHQGVHAEDGWKTTRRRGGGGSKVKERHTCACMVRVQTAPPTHRSHAGC